MKKLATGALCNTKLTELKRKSLTGQPTESEYRAALNDHVTTKEKRRRPNLIPMILLEEKLMEHGGNVDLVAKDLDLIYYDLSIYVDKHPNLRLMIMRYREQLTDMAEANLRADLITGDQKATFLTLKTLGRDRGYVERTEHDKRVTVVNDTRQVDLSALSSDQLTQLKSIMTKAKSDDTVIIDHEPDA